MTITCQGLCAAETKPIYGECTLIGEYSQHGESVRSGRHRKSAVSRAAAALSDWFHQPFDYDWIVSYHSTRHLRGVLRCVFAAGTLSIALISLVMLFSSHGPTSTAGRAWVLAVLVLQISVAVGWLVLPMPSRRRTLSTVFMAFAVFGDVGLTSVLFFYDSFGRFIGCVLFAVTGAFCTYFMSAKWLTAHLLWSSGIIYLVGFLAYRNHDEDFATVAAVTGAVLIATNGAPLFAHIAWTLIARDAQRSTLDPLTGVFNRRGADNALPDLWSHAQERELALAVLVVDIDKFKRVNDEHGHARGDQVIILTAHRLVELIGDNGVLARTGGEEFLAVCAGQHEELRTIIRTVETGLYEPSDPVPVTASVGAALLPADSTLRNAGRSIVSRMSRIADSQMYRAKETGGNQVRITTL